MNGALWMAWDEPSVTCPAVYRIQFGLVIRLHLQSQLQR
jgi:hypothetical protein